MTDSRAQGNPAPHSAGPALRRKQVWIPLAVGAVIVLGSTFLGGDVPTVVYVAAGVGLIVLGLLRLLGSIDERSRHSRDLWLATAVWLSGFVLIGIWLVAKVDGLGVIGSVVGYVAFGHLLLAARASTRGAPWRGAVILAICMGGFVAGLLLISSTDPGAWWPWVPLVLLSGSVLAAPVGVSLLSADFLRRPGVMARRTRNIRTFTVLGGLIVVILTAVLLRQLAQVYWPVLVIGVAGFFLLGLIAARTQADTVLIALMLLVLAAIAAHPSPVAPAPGAGRIIVALGDSYMSGEGAGSFFSGTDGAGANECRRAPTAYPFVFAKDLGAKDYPGGVVSFACSGARAAHLNLPAAKGVPQYPGEPVGGSAGQTQFQQLEDLLGRRGADVDLILLDIGGNDSGFATIGTTCMAPGHCDELEKLWTGNLGNVRRAIRTTYASLKSILEQRGLRIPVLVVPYPDPIAPRRCPDIALAQTEIDFLHRFITQLDTVIKGETDAAKFLYMDSMQTAFVANKLRLCDGGPKTGVNFLSAQSINGSVEAQVYPKNWVHNSLHPNEEGTIRWRPPSQHG
ncbi:GDSL-type esterase/lipase family protein [Kribbella sp. NPDC050459]|uniref:GDSL-type esterase/lipase family protein n=1 Tax=Kribbella sp. NPDC050459 TaxID=3155785 RepID=UPI0033D4977D